MGLILNDKQCFSHGQLYVALSRVTSMEGIKVFSPNTCKGPGNNFVENVVYHELLNPALYSFREQHDPLEEPHLADYTEFEDDDHIDDDEDYEIYP